MVACLYSRLGEKGGETLSRLFTIFLLTCGICGWRAPLNAGVKDWSGEWEKFRIAYPYHIQVVALSGPDGAGRRLLIVSEPPPSVTLQDIVSLDPENFAEIATMRHGIGFDGWVKDVLIDLPPLEPARLRTLIDTLHEKIFGTAYKAVAVEIPSSPPSTNTDYQFDLRVPAARLRSWLLQETPASGGGWFWPTAFAALGLWGIWSLWRTRTKGYLVAILSAVVFLILYFGIGGKPKAEEAIEFRPVLGGINRTCAELMRGHHAGVFVSAAPGLVLWTINKAEGLDHYKREERQFALDSDIILGAARMGDFVAILARERVAP